MTRGGLLDPKLIAIFAWLMRLPIVVFQILALHLPIALALAVIVLGGLLMVRGLQVLTTG